MELVKSQINYYGIQVGHEMLAWDSFTYYIELGIVLNIVLIIYILIRVMWIYHCLNYVPPH